MTPRERFAAALEHKPLAGRVPTFELVFYLTMEAFGRVHPTHRQFRQWGQMSETERQLHREDMADVYVQTAEHYEHSAIFVQPPPVRGVAETLRLLECIREQSGDRYYLLVHGDPTFSIPSGARMADEVMWYYEHVDEAKEKAAKRVDQFLEDARQYAAHGALDGFALCSDYCFNDNPFLPPGLFAELITPYLAEVTAGYRELGFHVIKHTDGNIMPILDQLVATNPHALHSLDPQGGVDIAEVKRRYGDQVCLIGNVNCGLLQSGTEEEVTASARYCIEHGMPGGGYIFSTSNCAYTGLPLERYDLMWRIWHEEAVYPDPAAAQ
jgi:uroporphyrinogen decarboxylase